MSLSAIANGQNISILLSPPKSPETSPTNTYFDHYGTQIYRYKQIPQLSYQLLFQSQLAQSTNSSNSYQCISSKTYGSSQSLIDDQSMQIDISTYYSKRFSPSSLRNHTYSHIFTYW
ncbi:3619_t:CDS:2 [Ambispora gerdemannii]|uniref:3619_t:CDS:1 n=1 Tax=Ambispora gerdemannii TaxID=144530 RepID=A0A9N8YXV8_9GLOM|nr:3619_t:CDS:2 [Ambispora gerdemannii]